MFGEKESRRKLRMVRGWTITTMMTMLHHYSDTLRRQDHLLAASMPIAIKSVSRPQVAHHCSLLKSVYQSLPSRHLCQKSIFMLFTRDYHSIRAASMRICGIVSSWKNHVYNECGHLKVGVLDFLTFFPESRPIGSATSVPRASLEIPLTSSFDTCLLFGDDPP